MGATVAYGHSVGQDDDGHECVGRQSRPTQAKESCTQSHQVNHNDLCYSVIADAYNWTAAREACNVLNGDLVVLTKVTAITAAMRLVASTSASTVWIGLQDVGQSRSKLQWVDCQSSCKRTWKRINSAPNDLERCVVLNAADGSFDFQDCSNSNSFVCETSLESVSHRYNLEEHGEKKHSLRKMNRNVMSNIMELNAGLQAEGKLSNVVEMDIKYTPSQMNLIEQGINPNKASMQLEESIHRRKRNIMRDITNRWTDGILPYRFDGNLSSSAQDSIKFALEDMAKKTCVQFIEVLPGSLIEEFAIFGPYGGCWAYIGKVPQGALDTPHQPISIDPGCEDIGIIQHEVMHTLGLFHEHSRPDRDNYVYIDFDNTLRDRENQFEKNDESDVNMRGYGYDYSSIMHYPANAFAINASEPTIIPLPCSEGLNIGQRDSATQNDMAELNDLYECQGVQDGGWNGWSCWTACSTTCSGGIRTRTRQCNLPKPRNGGADCGQASLEEDACYTDVPCGTVMSDSFNHVWLGCWSDKGEPALLRSLEGHPLLNGIFTDRTDLEAFNSCYMAAKNLGLLTFALRGKECFNGSTADIYQSDGPSSDCAGVGSYSAIDVFLIYPADQQPVYVPAYGPWYKSGDCSLTCGDEATYPMSRNCTNPPPAADSGLTCIGDNTMQQPCATFNPCPVDGRWGEWTGWSQCDASCNTGTRQKTRDCDSPEPRYGGAPCSGFSDTYNFLIEDNCNTFACPITTSQATPTTVSTARAPTTVKLTCDMSLDSTISGAKMYFPFDQLCYGSFYGYPVNVTIPYSANIGPGRRNSALVLERHSWVETTLPGALGKCLHNPSLCDFTVAVWIKQTAEQKAESKDLHPNMIMTTGPESEGALTERQGYGFALYVGKNDMLKGRVRTHSTMYTVDIPLASFQEGEWVHVAITWSRLDGLTIFANGRPISTHDGDVDVTSGSENYTTLYLGRPGGCHDHFFSGVIDELLFWNYTLDMAEIEGVYQAVPPTCAGGCRTYAVCIDGSCVCNSLKGYTGDGNICYRMEPSDGGASSALPPLYFWSLDQVSDYTILGGDTEMTAEERLMALTQGVKENEKALTFNGKRDSVIPDMSMEHSLNLRQPHQGSFTVSVYLKYVGRPNHLNFILSSGGHDNAKSVTQGLSFFVNGTNGDGVIRVQTTIESFEAYCDLNMDTWNQYIIRWDARRRQLTIFRDGKHLASGISSPRSAPITNEGQFTIGKPNDLEANNGRFSLDLLAMWNLPVSDRQALDIYHYGSMAASKKKKVPTATLR